MSKADQFFDERHAHDRRKRVKASFGQLTAAVTGGNGSQTGQLF